MCWYGNLIVIPYYRNYSYSYTVLQCIGNKVRSVFICWIETMRLRLGLGLEWDVRGKGKDDVSECW